MPNVTRSMQSKEPVAAPRARKTSAGICCNSESHRLRFPASDVERKTIIKVGLAVKDTVASFSEKGTGTLLTVPLKCARRQAEVIRRFFLNLVGIASSRGLGN